MSLFFFHDIPDWEFARCHIVNITNCSFQAKAGRPDGGYEEGYVYVAAMLKSQTFWFMAVGRDRDQKRCQLLRWLMILPAPLPSLPGTQHQTRPPGPSRRMSGILSAHLLTALHVLTPVGWKPCRRTWGCIHLAPPWASTRVGDRRQWAEDQGNLANGWKRGSGMADCWVSESSWTELLSFCQHNKDLIFYFCLSPCWMKFESVRSWSKVLANRLSWRATNK